MTILLSIAALVVLVLVIAGVSRLVRKEQPEGSGGHLLSALVTAFLIIFAVVSLSVASQLAENSSGIAKVTLFLFIVVNTFLFRVCWTNAESC